MMLPAANWFKESLVERIKVGMLSWLGYINMVMGFHLIHSHLSIKLNKGILATYKRK